MSKLLKDAKTFNKIANEAIFYNSLNNYEEIAAALKDFAKAVHRHAEVFLRESADPNDLVAKRIHKLYQQQAKLIYDLVPEIEYLDQEIKDAESI
jgi:hypothetical protein